MGIAIPIPGFQEFIEEIPDGKAILLSGGLDNVPIFFAFKILQSAQESGRQIHLITSKRKHDTKELLERNGVDSGSVDIIRNPSVIDWKGLVSEKGLWVIDSFSFFMVGKNSDQVRESLNMIIDQCRSTKAIALLLFQKEMLSSIDEMMTVYLTDATIEFNLIEKPEGAMRYIRIPKWVNGEPLDQSIFYTFENGRMNIDLRSRVV